MKNEVKYTMKKEEKIYYNELIELNKNSMKKTWDTIKLVINRKKTHHVVLNFGLMEF